MKRRLVWTFCPHVDFMPSFWKPQLLGGRPRDHIRFFSEHHSHFPASCTALARRTTGQERKLASPRELRPSLQGRLIDHCISKPPEAHHGADIPQSARQPGIISIYSPPVITSSLPILASCHHLYTHLLYSPLIFTSILTSTLTSYTHLHTHLRYSLIPTSLIHLLHSVPILTSILTSHTDLLGLWASEEDGLCLSHLPLSQSSLPSPKD